MSIKSATTLFPLIDDPANIFYSGLKNIYTSLIEATPEVFRETRCKYRVEYLYPNITTPFSKVFDIRDFNNLPEIDGDYYLYFRIPLVKGNIILSETTVTGEDIPVNEYTFYPDFERSLSVVYKEVESYQKPDRLLLEESSNNFYIHILLDMNMAKLRNMKIGKEEYSSLYKPEIGRKWVIKSNGDWDLYSIDADFDEIKIDSSNVQFEDSSLKWVFPQLSPYKNHQLKLIFDVEEVEAGTQYNVYVYEKEYYEERFNTQKFANVKVYYTAEDVLCSAHVYSAHDIKILLNSIKFRNKKESNKKVVYRESVILSLCYITGLNIRYFLTATVDPNDISGSFPYRGNVSVLNNLSSTDTTLVASIQNSYPTITPPFTFDTQVYGSITYNKVLYLHNFIGFSKSSPYTKLQYQIYSFLLSYAQAFRKEYSTSGMTQHLSNFFYDGTNFLPIKDLRNYIIYQESLLANIGGRFNTSFLSSFLG